MLILSETDEPELVAGHQPTCVSRHLCSIAGAMIYGDGQRVPCQALIRQALIRQVIAALPPMSRPNRLESDASRAPKSRASPVHGADDVSE